MENFAIYSTNAVYRNTVKMIVSDCGLNCLLSESVGESKQFSSVENKPDLIIIDIFSRGITEHFLSSLRQVYALSRLVFVISRENPLRSYFSQKFGAFDLLYVEEGTEELKEKITGIINATEAKCCVGFNGLTMRECEVLRLIAQGKTSRQIAEELFISKNTVDTHRNKMLQKLNLSNSASLVTFACNAGLV